MYSKYKRIKNLHNACNTKLMNNVFFQFCYHIYKRKINKLERNTLKKFYVSYELHHFEVTYALLIILFMCQNSLFPTISKFHDRIVTAIYKRRHPREFHLFVLNCVVKFLKIDARGLLLENTVCHVI
jgi:hypothetical protein